MAKLTKRVVDAAESRPSDYVIWDDELPGFGLRVFASGKRSYVIQYRQGGRSRRFTIGLHGIWTPERARQEAKTQLGRVAQGEDPAEEKQIDHKSLSVKELCDLYLADLQAGLILGKGGRPKKPGTIVSDVGRINRHIVPLLGTRRVKDLTKADITKAMKDIMAGKTRLVANTKKLRGKSIVKGWRRHSHPDHRAVWRHPDLCRGRRHHRRQSSAWGTAAEGQYPSPASERGRISHPRRDAKGRRRK